MTDVRIVNDTGISNGTAITSAATGEPILGVRRATVSLDIDTPIVATLEMVAVTVDIIGAASFQVIDPATGELRVVAAIDWVDGGRSVF